MNPGSSAEEAGLAGLKIPEPTPKLLAQFAEQYRKLHVIRKLWEKEIIEGSDLAHRLTQARPSFLKAADLVATAADVLHYAHRLTP